MLCLKDGLILTSQLSYINVLVFQHTVILLLLTDTHRGQSQGVGPSQLIVASLGDDVILPCNPEPAVDSVSRSLEWGRPDLEPRFVHVRYEGQDLLADQNPSYKGRTSMSIEKLKHGDLSLTLSKVKVSDNGIYRCYIPSEGRKSTVQLVVGSVSSPVIAGININSNVVILQCESKDWYPEPEVFWLDGEGNLLSAGPTKTVRGPDVLYTVSSRVTVEKRHNNNFTCRVQQKKINQIRETHIDISAECPGIPSSFAARIIIVFAACFIWTLVFVFVAWKWHKTRETKEKQEEDEAEKLLAENKKKEKKAKLDEELQKNKEKQTDLEQMVNTVMEQKKELDNQKDQLSLQQEAMEKMCDEIEKNVQSVEKETESDRVRGFIELKEIILEVKKSLRERKYESQKLQQNTDKLMIKTNTVFNTMTNRKRAVEDHMEKIREQQQEILEQSTDRELNSSRSDRSLDDN
ncbi:butyrophilin subfamily 1 member A1-like [Thunnus albacares]|uniref:butyrophilin subfamily 1 member A1-like n=1 Tax=Thunnus albacares TaxID=8236 RepID=UPI001CF6530A|nr:butyrophilin subfamily 1 member A1-like [Thunnus albacares]